MVIVAIKSIGIVIIHGVRIHTDIMREFSGCGLKFISFAEEAIMWVQLMYLCMFFQHSTGECTNVAQLLGWMEECRCSIGIQNVLWGSGRDNML